MSTLEEAFDGLRHLATRIEVLPFFAIPEEAAAVAASIDGAAPQLGFLSEWHEYLTESSEAGMVHRRLRLVTVPPTDYEKFEIRWAYPANAQRGEHIRLMPRDAAPAAVRDVWLFDEDEAIELLYDQSGSYVGERRLPLDEATPLRRWISTAWDAATELTEFDMDYER